MKKCLIRNDFHNFNFKELCGINILSGNSPIAVNFKNEEIIDISGDLSQINNNDGFCSSEYVSINADKCIIIFDLKKTFSPDRILICSAYSCENDIGLANYELYMSDAPDKLFERKNKIVEYDNTSVWIADSNRNGCDQVFDIEDYDGRYFAIKIANPNPTDSITRISYVGLYNHEFTEQLTFCENNFGENVLKGKLPTAKGTYTADLSCLTNGICFNSATRINMDTDTSYSFKLDEEIIADSFYLIGSDNAVNSCKIYATNDKDKLFDDESQIHISIFPKPTSHNGISAAVCMADQPINFKHMAFCFEKGSQLDQLGIMPFDTITNETAEE